MTENTTPKQVLSHRMKDKALMHFVSCANIGAGVGITLLVNGQVVYGDLISGKEYCEQMYKKISSAKGDPLLAESIASYFNKLGENTYTKENNADVPLNYLHLEKVAYLKGDGHQVNMNGTLLRIRIEDVNGFSLGRP